MSWQAELTHLAHLAGKAKVSTDPEILAAYSGDKWYASHLPEAVVFPECTQDVVEVMQFADKYAIPVTARGAGVGYVGGCVPIRGGIVISLERMTRILELSPTDGTAVVQPGVLTADLQNEAEALGWFYPPDPASRKECSIGGNIATNAGGPRCLKYGVTAAYVLGLEVVLANGDILRCGGRTHKNKTGFNLAALFVGAEGMLGIITEATLRIIPHPQARAALAISFDQFQLAADAVVSILNAGHLPSALEITDSFTLAAARNYLGGDTLPANGKGHVIVELDGRRAGLHDEVVEIEALMTKLGAIKIIRAETPNEVENIWQLRREFSYALKATGMTKLNEDIVIPRSRLVALVNYCDEQQRRTGLNIACFGHSGDGNIHTNIMVDNYQDPDKKEVADQCVDELFRWVMQQGGTITGEHGVGLAKAKWFRDAVGDTSLKIHRAIKQSLDPQGILNPGKLGL
ncbi:MAG: FAD-binding oxidoreductase [Akkermansia sp.]